MPPPGPPSFAVVVPAFNEETGIEACVAAIDEVLGALPNRTRLVVVEDGSADRTLELLDGLERRHERLLVVRHPVNRGYGAALRTGAATAGELGLDYVVFMDSDLTNDPRSLPAFAAAMAGVPDVVKATRRSHGGGYAGVPWNRVFVAALGNAVARALYGLPLHDPTNGFRAVRTELLLHAPTSENDFAVIMEELYRLAPYAHTYVEVPVVLTDRAEHLRASTFSYRPGLLWRYLRWPLLAARDRLVGRR